MVIKTDNGEINIVTLSLSWHRTLSIYNKLFLQFQSQFSLWLLSSPVVHSGRLVGGRDWWVTPDHLKPTLQSHSGLSRLHSSQSVRAKKIWDFFQTFYCKYWTVRFSHCQSVSNCQIILISLFWIERALCENAIFIYWTALHCIVKLFWIWTDTGHWRPHNWIEFKYFNLLFSF